LEAELTFDRNKSGTITGLVLHQNGVDRRAPKIVANEPVK
jgi:hypothetical protein